MTRRIATLILTLAWLAPAIADDITFARDELWIETADGRHRFDIEVAETNRQMARGLMFRTDIADDAGMLFDYRRPQRIAMWMKNTLIPLDMLFIADDGTIVRIESWTTPLSLATISSGGPVRAVIELKGGISERLGIRPGDRVIYEAFVP